MALINVLLSGSLSPILPDRCTRIKINFDTLTRDQLRRLSLGVPPEWVLPREKFSVKTICCAVEKYIVSHYRQVASLQNLSCSHILFTFAEAMKWFPKLTLRNLTVSILRP